MDGLDIAVIGASSADLITTELVLANNGFREFNPILQNKQLRITTKVLAPVIVIGISRLLDKRGHKGWSRALKWGAVIVYSGAAVNNIIQMKKRDR
jgi:hypothetical protein